MAEDIDGGIHVDGEDTLQLRGMACDEGRAIAPLLLTLISVKMNSIFTRMANVWVLAFIYLVNGLPRIGLF